MIQSTSPDSSIYYYWGKARQKDENGPACHLLPYHCLDVAAVGEVLLEQHLHLLKHFEALFRLHAEVLKPWLIFMLAAHDLGKFAESFQQLCPDLRMKWWGHIKKSVYDLRHDSLGYLLWHDPKSLRSFLSRETGSGFVPKHVDISLLYRKVLKVWLQPITGHHGLPPKVRRGTFASARSKSYFRQFDIENAIKFLDVLNTLFEPDWDALLSAVQDKAWTKMQKEATWILAGFTVLCDWIGSDNDVFEYSDKETPLDDYWKNCALSRAYSAVKRAGLLPSEPASAKPLHKLFKYIKKPTPLQVASSSIPLPQGPQLIILEDVTGSGKTEAALMLAHRLMAQGLATGIYIALPTMATANAMFERMAAVYRSFYAHDQRPSIVLTHTASYLSELFQTALFNNYHNDSPYGENEDTASIQCTTWLADHRKASLLAEVGIGTLDQALLGILPARHQSLRLLGLVNKVLIVDEVHAYDAYMNRLLQTLLHFHARMGGTAILLSATLPQMTRQEMIDAFSWGITKDRAEISNSGYPLLTHFSSSGLDEIPIDTRDEVKRNVKVELLFDENTVLSLIHQAVKQGKCVCWVRNTVFDARKAFVTLRRQHWVAKDKLSLFHSRFALKDRLALEEKILRLFGKNSGPETRNGRILVATQVVEQSLDLDFDVMVSDLAPMDLLIQRAGRLCRHVRDKNGERLQEKGIKDQRGIPIFFVYSPRPEDSPQTNWFKEVFPKVNAIYPHTGQLWRTARLLAREKGWHMPDDAREFIEWVYGEQGEAIPKALIDASDKAEGEYWAQAGMAGFNALIMEEGYTFSDGKWDEEAKIPTRLSDDSQTVYLSVWKDGCLRPYATAGRFPWDLSAVNVRADVAHELSEDLGKDVLEAVTRLKETEKALNKFSMVLPLQHITSKRLIGKISNTRGEPVDVMYSKILGLLLGEDIEEFGEIGP
ncbi:MAG: CRISPR-associated helicase Cas3' [Dissulfuribacterales bacterium]